MTYPIRTLHQLRPLLIGLRKKAGLSQASLAAQLGITQQSYAKIEANPTATSFERLYNIVRLLGGELYLTTHGENADAPGKAPATNSAAARHTSTAHANAKQQGNLVMARATARSSTTPSPAASAACSATWAARRRTSCSASSLCRSPGAPRNTGGTYEPTGADELNQLQRLIDYGVITGMASPADVLPLEQSEGKRKPRTDGSWWRRGT